LNRLADDDEVTTLQQVELGVLGPLQVRQYGLPVAIPGVKPRAILTMLGLHGGSVVSADALVELLWGDDPPRTAAKALQTHISSLRRTLGDGFVLTAGTGWTLTTTEIDASRYKAAASLGRDAVAAGDTSQAVAHLNEALALWRGVPELPEGSRGTSEKTRWIEGHAALVEDRADALLATGRAAEIIGELESAVGDAPLRERRWGQLMLALYRAGRQGEALGAFRRARSLLADELGVDPGPDLRRLEAAIVAQDDALEMPVSPQLQSVTRAVTFLLTDIEGSTAAWEAQADAMAMALARHDEIVEQVVTSRGGRLIKTRGEGDATFSVFDRPSAAAAGAIELQEAIRHEPWELLAPMRIRVALHTGEVELRDGDYFGRAVNRAARLRSLAAGGQILCSGAAAELVIDTLPDDVVLADLGMRQLKNLARPEHVFELRLETADELQAVTPDAPIERPALPAVLAGPGPFVGRGRELERLLSTWHTALDGGAHAVLIAGEPGVGKTRLAGEWSRHAYEQGAIVLYGRCDEDLGAPYQPFAEALRSLLPSLGASRLRGLRGVEGLLSLVPGLTDVLPDLAAPTRADPDTERYALFDAVVAVLGVASTNAPVVLILDDLHWAAKPTLLLLRHLLRFGEHARVQVVGTYRSTDLDRSHPLAAMLADLNRDGSATRLQLSGLDQVDVSAYLAEAGYDDEELARALATVTGGNPFFLIEALRHVDESGGRWDPSTLPQGVREAVSRRLSRLPTETNKALAAAAVVGSHFALALVESVVGEDLIDAFDEASKAGIVIEEPGGRYRFNHAIVRQSLLAELASVRRMRLHQKIAATLETQPGADDELLAELAYHYFECAWAGNAAKAVEYCRRAADQAMARLAYEGAADLYDRAWHALEEIDDELPDRGDQQAELLVARCEALLTAGDVASATGAVSQLQEAARDSGRLAAWGTCFDGQLSMLTDPERLDEIESAVGAAAEKLAGLDDAAGEAMAHTVRAGCLARLGRIGDCETALDQALTAARRAGEHRRVNAVLAQAPLAALWGPNPVPRAGGRCLDVVRLLRITTGSPVVEATSTRCQGVLDAFRGRAAAGRQLIDSARRTLTELGMRHARLEVDQFAGIVELVADDPAAAEPHLWRAYNGFRRMGLDVDTAETAALLARACLALDRDAEADELCAESERLAGHALKASIAWRTVRAQLLARSGAHEDARQIAEEAVTMAGHTDALVDHGDACLALAAVLDAAGGTAGARAAAEQAVGLYELKGATALAEKARKLLGDSGFSAATESPETPSIEFDNACVRVGERLVAAVDREAWDEFEQMFAPDSVLESRRKIVGFTPADLPAADWRHHHRLAIETSGARLTAVVIAVRGDRLALARLVVGTADASPGAPHDEFLSLYGIDQHGRIALQMWFDIEDMDAALAELDAAHARLGEQHQSAPRLENAASRADAQFNTLFTERRWEDIGHLLTAHVRAEDRRRGLRREGNDRATLVAEAQAAAAIGVTSMASEVIAIRAQRLALVRTRFETAGPDAFIAEIFRMVEVDDDGLLVAAIVFDPDDIDAAIVELDARYLAGEAALYAHTWSVITDGHAAVNRRELPPTAPDLVSIDHRRAAAFAPGEGIAYIRAGWDLDQFTTTYIEQVHLLNDLGAVYTHAGHGVSNQGFDAEWRGVDLLTVEDDMVNRCELFDEADLNAALARFEQLTRPAPLLENAASRVTERFLAYFAARDWGTMAEILTDDYSSDDRRRVVSAGVRHGRDAEIVNMRAIENLWITDVTATVIATRGERLTLMRARYSGRDQGPEVYLTEILGVIEIDTDDRISSLVVFDPDDLDTAFAELDARYLAGDAAPHAHTWSVIAKGYGAFNRRELLATTPEWENVDHRRGAAFAPGDMIAYIHAAWDDSPDTKIYIAAVHRLSNLGGVVTHVAHGISQEGFDAEWRDIHILTVEGQAFSRCELFDETDLDAALVRFDELSRPAPRLENAASQLHERFQACFAARDWDAIAELFADDTSTDDRRPLLGVGVRCGRDAVIADWRATADVGVQNITSTVIATRGDRVALNRYRFSGRDQRPEAFRTEVLGVIEIESDQRIAACVMLDLDDIGAAFEELDARYLVGEAAAHAQTWSVITGAFAAVNRHDLPELTPDWVNVDHRRAASFAPGELAAYTRATWEQLPDVMVYVEAVHRLTDFGAVVTQMASGTSQEGFHAEWHESAVYTVEDDRLGRCELFDESELDAAIAKFDELSRPAPRLENAASQVCELFKTHFAARDWVSMAEILAEDVCHDDRRRMVGAGVRHGREAHISNLQAIADVQIAKVTLPVVATRGARLVLSRSTYSGPDSGPQTSVVEALEIIEIDADKRVVRVVSFDLDEIDAAFEELDARYVVGEAAAYAHTWSVIARGLAAFNSRELPGFTPDSVNIDHRRARGFAPGDLTAYIGATWDLAPDVSAYAEAVHRLSNLGAVFAHAVRGTSQDGFYAEWREICLATVEGDLISRIEMFDEADLDAALARFDELTRPAPPLENAASRTFVRFNAYLAARDWDAMAELIADDVCNDDRRHVVSGGIQRGRDAQIANLRAVIDVGVRNMESVTIAIRGERLALTHTRVSGGDQQPEAFGVELLNIVEINTDNRIVAGVLFDLNDIGAALEELDARYLAGEAAAYAHTWSVITRAIAAFNRHELPEFMPDWVNIDHRRARWFAPGDLTAYIGATLGLAPNVNVYVEGLPQLSNLGAVFTLVTRGTSQDGFDAEWREIVLATIEGDLINRIEVFDEADLDDALARFDELSRLAPRLENAVTQVAQRFWMYFAARDWDGIAGILDDGYYSDDRRRVVGAGVRHGRDGAIPNMRTIADLGFTNAVTTAIATRGHRLGLVRSVYSGRGQETGTVVTDVLAVAEVNADDRIAAIIVFDSDAIDAAFAELDARYLAGEAAPHAHTWSVLAAAYAAFNRREFLATTPEWEDVDHRRGAAFAPGDMIAYIRAAWDDSPDTKIYIAAVHRLSNLGGVVTHIAHGISQEGFDAEWRDIHILTVEGETVSRSELFDETDLDAALARFDELSRPAPRLENAASRVAERLGAYFADHDWHAMADTLSDDICTDDRRRVVGAGIRHGRDAEIASMRATAEVGTKNIAGTVMASRGDRLVLTRVCFSGRDQRAEAFRAEVLGVIETNADDRIVAVVVFDPNDIDAAFEELDARYLAGEAAEHSHTWSLIARTSAAFNRHVMPPTTPDWINIDHRKVTAFAPGDMTSYMRATFDVAPDIKFYIETVHRLTNVGAVFTQPGRGISHEGFEAEWRDIILMSIEGDQFNRCEVFDEADMEAALARFDELSRPAP
jgi:DNA-binding SARP family transcriptional activator